MNIQAINSTNRNQDINFNGWEIAKCDVELQRKIRPCAQFLGEELDHFVKDNQVTKKIINLANRVNGGNTEIDLLPNEINFLSRLKAAFLNSPDSTHEKALSEGVDEILENTYSANSKFM